VTTRLFGLLVLLTIVPAAFVLWFMNAAVGAETDTARQRVVEAYRGQLRFVRERLDPLWRAHASALDRSGTPGTWFEHLVTERGADGALVLGPAGELAYPDAAARAALRAMDERRAREPNARMPTHAALRLSIDFAEAERPVAMPGVLRETSLLGVWALSSGDGHVIALYRTGRLEAMMHDFLHQVETEGVRFVAIPPGEPADSEAIAAGAWLPGWQLTFVPLESGARDAETSRRRTFYVAVALAGVVLIALMGAAVGAAMRRHLQVARLKTDLAAAASHELRTPLAATQVLVDGLLADSEPDARKTREYLQLIAAENARLSRLVENFLTFAGLDRGAARAPFRRVDPGALVQAAVDTVRPRLADADALRVEVSPGLPPVFGDADALRGALVNLIDNALKYTNADKRIVVRAVAGGPSHVQFEVTDNGIGIPPREQRRIFRRFYRVDPRLAGHATGVGLGLSIVEAVMRAHRGTVSVHSGPGEGSTFALRVPCPPPEAAS
jgi:signal transduction histidine kinase